MTCGAMRWDLYTILETEKKNVCSKPTPHCHPSEPTSQAEKNFHFPTVLGWLGCPSLCILMLVATESIIATKDHNNVSRLVQEKSVRTLRYQTECQAARVTQKVATI